MSQVQPKQVFKIQSSFVRVVGLATGAADTTTATTPITTALASAGSDNAGGTVGVPVQVSSGGGVGVVTALPYNRVEVYDTVSGDKILAANQEEVYARLSEAGGVYTLTYYTTPNSGVETAYTFPATANIDFEFAYRFDFNTYPIDAGIGIQSRHISDNPAGSGAKAFAEQLTVTAANTIADLTKTPFNAATVELIVNGVSQDSIVDFTMAGKAITWNTAAAKFPIATTDRVIARYQTVE